MKELFKKQIALPQDHGSWVFILSPLLIGIFAGGTFTYGTFNLIIAAMSAFMIRQPMTIIVKAISGRRPRNDLSPALFWVAIYGVIAALSLTALILEGFSYMLWLSIPGAPVFAWHLWLVTKREERKQASIEVIATGVLSLAAPAAYWVSRGGYDPTGWWLWALTWLQSAASIVYAYLRLEQREWKSIPDRRARFRAGWRAYLYTSFNLFAAILLGPVGGLIPTFIFTSYLVQWLEVLWGIEHPAQGWKPTRIGVRQLIVSVLWTVLFIVFWR